MRWTMLETKYGQFAALAGWLLLAGCFVAVNAAPSVAARTVIALTLGLGGVAGWLQVVFWLSECSSQQAQYEESRIAHEQEIPKEPGGGVSSPGQRSATLEIFRFHVHLERRTSQRVPRNHCYARRIAMRSLSNTLATKSSRATRPDTSPSFIPPPDRRWLRLSPKGPIWSSRRLRKSIPAPIKSASALTPTSRTSLALLLESRKAAAT